MLYKCYLDKQMEQDLHFCSSCTASRPSLVHCETAVRGGEVQQAGIQTLLTVLCKQTIASSPYFTSGVFPSDPPAAINNRKRFVVSAPEKVRIWILWSLEL